ncbi:hypothetical protein CSPX01_05749 [Colletotrichum filicis]|nr:hypothetical protein CSPX01_05749 [Colletotrichum filicis]
MKLAPVLSILVAGLSFASAQVCPDKNLMECYEYCDFNNKPNDAFVAHSIHDDSSIEDTQDRRVVDGGDGAEYQDRNAV